MTFANWLTIGRILLVPFFITALIYYVPGQEQYRITAFILFIAAAITDCLDGFIARAFKQKSNFGTFLDPLADKILVVSGYLSIAFSSAFVLKPPVWVVIIIVSRDIVIVAGLLLIFISSGKVKIQPNFLGKLTAFFQMATLASLLLVLPFSPVLWYITALLTIVSGIFYVIREGRRMNGTATA
jgi:cardiolipin synthase